MKKRGSFLEEPAAESAATGAFPDAAGHASSPEAPGALIGQYKLIEPIGEGGMGTVWMAQQTEPVKRLVAIKLIKAGMDSRQVIARFEAERQALALMDHANIARVLEAGTTSAGRPYFVMDLVKGVPITRYCDEHHLTPRQRLELFIPVCQAVQHAHQKGIIHRDLKPSNVLVALYDGKPVPKVIDFGVAKAAGQSLTEKTLVTGFGAIVGTLEYMSPEQAEINQLDIDTRSDIYSLGVLLYELLAGSTPFTRKDLEQAGMLEMLRVIREQEPSKPSTKLSTADGLPTLAANRGMEPAKLTKLVRGELDWIVMKALEKDRSRRYDTANGFAMDVQRYLTDEPVLACPPSARLPIPQVCSAAQAYAGNGRALRHRVGRCGGRRHRHRRLALRDRKAHKQELARKAERDLALTEQGVRQAVEQAAKFRGELHAVLAVPGGVQDLLNQPGRWNLLIQSAQSELGQARRSTARGERRLSAELMQSLHNLEEQLGADEADRLLAMRLETIRLDQATWVEVKFDFRKGAAEYPQALARFAVLKDDAGAVAARIRSSPIKEQLVAALDDWALVSFELRNEHLAEQLLAVARQAAPDPAWADRLRQLEGWRDQKALGALVEQAPLTRLLPQTLALVGSLLPQQKSIQQSWLRRAQSHYPADFWLNLLLGNALYPADPAEAAGFYRVALAVRPTSSAAYHNLGNALFDQKKLTEAIDAYRKAIEIDPKHSFAHHNLGGALRDQKKLPEAIAAYRKTIEIDPKHPLVYNNLGNCLRDQMKLPEAIAAFHKAIEIDPRYTNAYVSLGLALCELKKLPEAVAAFRKAIEIDPKFAHAYNGLGYALRKEKKLAEAIAAYRKALELDPSSFWAHDGLGNALQDEGDVAGAIACFRKTVELDPNSPWMHNRLAWMLATCPDAKLRDAKLAVSSAERAVALKPEVGTYWNTLGAAQYRAGQWQGAVAALEKSMELGKGGDGIDWFFLAMARWRLGNRDEARKHYDQAVQWMDKNQPENEELRRFRSEAAELLELKEKK